MDKQCAYCGNTFTISNKYSKNQKKSKRFCSYSCSAKARMQDPHQIEIAKNNLIAYNKRRDPPWNKGERGVMPRPWNKGKKGVMPRPWNKDKKLGLNPKHSEKMKELYKLGILINPNLGKKQPEEIKQRLREIVKEMWKDPEYQSKQKRSRNLKPNKFEIGFYRTLFPILSKNGIIIHYNGNFQKFIGGRNPDFLLFDYSTAKMMNKVIELFGDYYHGKQKNIEDKTAHQIERMNHYEKEGFQCLIIWESEWKKSKDDVITRVIEFCKNNDKKTINSSPPKTFS